MIVISTEHAVALERSARKAKPLEFCGALLGRSGRAGTRTTTLLRLRNSDPRPGRFAIAGAFIRHAENCARESGHEVLAIVHSHASSPPALSDRDRTALRYSAYPWLIAGFDEQDCFQLAAFRSVSCEPIELRVGADARSPAKARG